MTEFRKIASLRYQYEISEDGKILRNIFTRRPRKFYKNDNGYLCVNVQFGNFKKTVYVAALVAECWLGIKPLGFQIDHIDHDKCNNHRHNLRYVPPSSNVRNSPSRRHNPVVLTDSKGTWHFKTMTAAARFISKKKQKTVRCCMRKFNGRKEKVFGYTVKYYFKHISSPQNRPKVIQLSLFEDYEFVAGRLIYRRELNA